MHAQPQDILRSWQRCVYLNQLIACMCSHAILPLRGTILNVERKDDAALYKNQELAALIVALGLGTKGGSGSSGSKKGRGSAGSSRRGSSSVDGASPGGSLDEAEQEGEVAAVNGDTLKGLR